MKKLITIALLLAVSFSVYAQDGYVHKRSEEYVYPDDPQVLAKLDEWRDLKFGVIFHWGLYAVPGIVESWSICSEDVDWIRRDTTMTYNDYKKWYWGLIDKFNPVKFNPEQWAQVCNDAGMKYVVFTTKHHDGFNMFDTKYSDFSITHGAFRNNARADVAKYVFEAFRNQKFMIGAYFSKPDWHSQYYWWDYLATSNRNVNYNIKRHPERWAAFQNFVFNQIGEIVHNYGSIDILWLDGGQVNAANNQDIKMDKIAQMARAAQPGILIVDRTIHGKYENYQTPERSIPEKQLPYPWESCITLSDDWGWVPNAKFKSANQVIAMLVEVTAKGGNLLLGVGPTAEGVIQPEVTERLEKIGTWLKANGKAIYGTRNAEIYNSGNVWFTAAKDGKNLYALCVPKINETLADVITWEGNVPAKNSKIILLKTNKPVKWSVSGNAVKVFLPKNIDKSETIALSFTK